MTRGQLFRHARADHDDVGVFDYTETSGNRGCPRRTQVTVELLEDGALRFEERRRGGRVAR